MNIKLRRVVPLLLALLLTGCWDKVELEKRAFVIGLGIDAAEGGVRVTAEIPVDKGEESGGKLVYSAEARSVPEALALVESAMSRRGYYGHTKLVVFGEKLLADAALFRSALDALERNNEISHKVVVLAAEGGAGDIVGSAGGEEPTGIFIADYYENSENAMTAKMDLEELTNALRTGGSALIPKIVRSGGGDGGADEEQNGDAGAEFALCGGAVIRDYALTGSVDGLEMQGLSFLRGDGSGAELTVSVDGAFMPMAVSGSSRKLAFAEKDGHLLMTVSISLDGSVEGGVFGSEAFFDSGNINTLEKAFAAEVGEQASDAFAALQAQSADAIGVREYLRKWNYPLYEEYAADWARSFGEMELEVCCTVLIDNTGAVK